MTGVWHPPFRLAGALWADWIAPALGQLGLPSPTRALYASAMNSRIVDVDDTLDGRTNVRGWVRTWRDTGRPVYTAVYAEAVTDGVCTMNIAFPLPWGRIRTRRSSAPPGIRVTPRAPSAPPGSGIRERASLAWPRARP